MSQDKDVVKINGVDYDRSTLSPNVLRLVEVYNRWAQDREDAIAKVNEARLELAKTEAAIRDLSAEIITAVEKGE